MDKIWKVTLGSEQFLRRTYKPCVVEVSDNKYDNTFDYTYALSVFPLGLPPI